MSSRKVTPRGLIQGVLDTHSVSKSATNVSRTRRRRSLRTSLSGATPGTLIKGVLKTSSTAKKSPARQSRVVATPPRSSVRRSARVSRLQSIGQDPTPRGLIQGYLASTAPETPAVRAVIASTPDVSTERDVERENYPGKVADLISPDVDTPEILSQGLSRSTRAGRKRQRQAVDSVKDTFQSGVHQRIQKEVVELPAFSDSMVPSPTLQSIPEELEVGQIPLTEAASSTDEDERFDRQEEEEIAVMAQLATQPQGGQTTKAESVHEPMEGTEASVQDTSAISLSQTSIGEVAAANTVQIHQNSQRESVFEDGPQSDQDGSQSDSWEERLRSAKRLKVAEPNAENLTIEGKSQRVQERISLQEVEEEHKSMQRKSLGGEMLAASPASQAAYLEQSTDTSAVGFLSADEEPDVSRIYSPLNTPSELPKAKRNTPPAKTPALLRREKENAVPTTSRLVHRVPVPTTSRVVHRVPHRRNPKRKQHILPLSLTKSIFSHFCRGRVSRDAWDAVEDCSEAFFEQLSKDLAHYTKHANRKTIQQEDVILLMKRQGQVSDKQSLYYLIEKYLSMEYRQELIPCAQPGGGVQPSQ